MPLTTQQIHKQNLTKIEKIFSQKILSWKYFEDGFDNFAYEINENWIFKIPKRENVWEMLKREKDFLDLFFEISPVQVPEFEFFGEEVVGYKKISGQKLTAELLNSLDRKQKNTVAKSLGEFLAKLHTAPFQDQHVSEYRDFYNQRGFEKLLPKIHELVLPKVPQKTRENILAFLSDVQANEKNFDHVQGTVHADLYYNHMYWDTDKEKIAGIIDFGEISINAVTMDFTLLADFCDPHNDSFLENLLSAYSSGDSDLFRKVKIFSKVEKLYWPIEDIEDSKIQPTKLDDLEKSLEKVGLIFGK
jgi:aminoglycoside 2''-phosphotransferase